MSFLHLPLALQAPFGPTFPLVTNVVPSTSAHCATLTSIVNDFIGLCQGTSRQHLQALPIIFDAVDQVFCPLSPKHPPSCQELISVKKLGKGYATWATQKLVLGWILDTVEETILLPQRPLDCLRAVLDALPRSKMCIAVSAWHKTLGKLCSMSLAIPGLCGLFSLL